MDASTREAMKKKPPTKPKRITNEMVHASYLTLLEELQQQSRIAAETHDRLFRLIQRRETAMREDFDDKLVKYRTALRECMDQIATPLFGVEKILLRMDAIRDDIERMEKRFDLARPTTLWQRIRSIFK